MGLKERFRQGLRGRGEASEAARRERAAARAREREARADGRPPARRIGSTARTPARQGSDRGPRGSTALDAGAAVLTEAAKVVLEVFVLVAQAWIAVAEVAGRLVLAIWLRALPLARAGSRAALAAVRLAQQRVEPAHGTLAVAGAALTILVLSQFFDYRGVSVGTGEYAGGVESVAPAPEVSREQTGDAHGWVVLPIAALALVATVIAVLRRRRAAWLLIPAGFAVLAIALLVDMPKGLDEGSAAVAYEGARAALLEGFWVQLFAGGTLIACGMLLPSQLAALGQRRSARGNSARRQRGGTTTRSRAAKAARA